MDPPARAGDVRLAVGRVDTQENSTGSKVQSEAAKGFALNRLKALGGYHAFGGGDLGAHAHSPNLLR
jgi:hypothetical protein